MELTNPTGLGISVIVHIGIPKLEKIGKPEVFKDQLVGSDPIFDFMNWRL